MDMQWRTTQVDRGILELQMDGEDMYNQCVGLILMQITAVIMQ